MLDDLEDLAYSDGDAGEDIHTYWLGGNRLLYHRKSK